MKLTNAFAASAIDPAKVPGEISSSPTKTDEFAT